jgi:hypothetical protein
VESPPEEEGFRVSPAEDVSEEDALRSLLLLSGAMSSDPMSGCGPVMALFSLPPVSNIGKSNGDWIPDITKSMSLTSELKSANSGNRSSVASAEKRSEGFALKIWSIDGVVGGFGVPGQLFLLGDLVLGGVAVLEKSLSLVNGDAAWIVSPFLCLYPERPPMVSVSCL